MRFRLFSTAVGCGFLCGALAVAIAQWAVLAREPAVDAQAPSAESRASTLSADGLPAACTSAPVSAASARLDERRQVEALLAAVRQVEVRMRSNVSYAAQIERALQGIDKAMSTVPTIEQRAKRVKAVVDP